MQWQFSALKSNRAFRTGRPWNNSCGGLGLEDTYFPIYSRTDYNYSDTMLGTISQTVSRRVGGGTGDGLISYPGVSRNSLSYLMLCLSNKERFPCLHSLI